MTGIEAPQRKAWLAEANRLAKLDGITAELLTSRPQELHAEQIHQAPAILQARGNSLAFAPGSSEAHIRDLASRITNRKVPLDAVKVVAFGDKWFLLDGHHRMEAYARAKWTKAIPVEAVVSPLRGRERVDWAYGLSVSENDKVKLNLNRADRNDAAWRAVVARSGSIIETAKGFGVSPRTVSNMREALRALEARGAKPAALMDMSWGAASFRAKDQEGNGDFDANERKQRLLAKRLEPVLKLRPSAVDLLAVLEAARPGVSIELETAISLRREAERAEDI